MCFRVIPFIYLCISFSVCFYAPLLYCPFSPPVSSLTPILPHSATCSSSRSSFSSTFLIARNLHIFLPLSSSIAAPSLSSAYTPSIPATFPLTSTPWHPTRLRLLPALSSFTLASSCPLPLPAPCCSVGHSPNKLNWGPKNTGRSRRKTSLRRREDRGGGEGGGLRRGAGSAEPQDRGEDAASPGAGRPALPSRGRGWGDAHPPRGRGLYRPKAETVKGFKQQNGAKGGVYVDRRPKTQGPGRASKRFQPQRETTPTVNFFRM